VPPKKAEAVQRGRARWSSPRRQADPERRSEVAKIAAEARWSRRRDEDGEK
jgi:hypothetical protein